MTTKATICTYIPVQHRRRRKARPIPATLRHPRGRRGLAPRRQRQARQGQRRRAHRSRRGQRGRRGLHALAGPGHLRAADRPDPRLGHSHLSGSERAPAARRQQAHSGPAHGDPFGDHHPAHQRIRRTVELVRTPHGDLCPRRRLDDPRHPRSATRCPPPKRRASRSPGERSAQIATSARSPPVDSGPAGASKPCATSCFDPHRDPGDHGRRRRHLASD